MSSASNFHDQDFDALESQFEHRTAAPQYAPNFVSRFSVWKLGRRLARQKKREGGSFQTKATVDYYQPLVASGGWITAGPISVEVTKFAEDLLVENFNKRNLTVSGFWLGWTGMCAGTEGTYQSFTAHFNVT